jgi:hypothetical protein
LTLDYRRQKQNQENTNPESQLSSHNNTTGQQPARLQQGPTMSV